MDPAILTVTELVDGLRAGAAGSYPVEAATELLIRHWRWLARPEFLRACLRALDGDPELRLAVDWSTVEMHVTTADAPPSERAVAVIAAQLGQRPDQTASPPRPTSSLGLPLGFLLTCLERRDVDMVLAAISHSAGTQDHVEHVGEPNATGEWRPTSTSPRLRLGPLHPWPEPALPGLD
jgi:hypothetical protein